MHQSDSKGKMIYIYIYQKWKNNNFHNQHRIWNNTKQWNYAHIFWIYNAHSSRSKYPSQCQSLGHQSLSPPQSRELRQTQLTRAKAKQIGLTWQSNSSQSARLNFLTEWCSCLNLGPKMANGAGDALQKLHPRPRSTYNLQDPSKR